MDQANRFLNPSLGDGVFDRVGGKTLWEIHTDVIPQEELQRYVFSLWGRDGES